MTLTVISATYAAARESGLHETACIPKFYIWTCKWHGQCPKIETFSPFLLLQSMLELTPQNQKKIIKKKLPTYISGRMLKPVNNQYVKTSEVYN